MQEYCENDANTLIDVYAHLRPVIHDHPNTTGATLDKTGRPSGCTSCTITPNARRSDRQRITQALSRAWIGRASCRERV